MLKKMTIENFKSFKNETIIDLSSSNYKILNKRNVNENEILKGAIFVGGNATGKTSIILALRTLLDLLFREKWISIGQYKCLFSEENIIKLTYEFKIDSDSIKYAIEFDVKKKILIEKLLLNEDLVLDRIGNSGKSQISEVTTFNDLDNSILLLRTIYFNTKFYGNEILQKWFKFLSNSVYIDAATRTLINSNSALEINKYLKENGDTLINEFFKSNGFNYFIEYTDRCKGNLVEIDTEGEKKVFFKRNNIGEPIPVSMESLGNINLLSMLPAFFHVVKEGGMLIIDEFSSAFHNELEELLVKYFMKNSLDSQIFLVSHSTNLLSNTIFRPDQEYAVDFKGKEGSYINKFSNEKPREAQNIEKMYNSGCFGGMPEYVNE
ncbi:MAG: ATP-binding protein [Tissierellales bacterium]|jgi:AAA15 family ATPase/GTPase|nr:ATP-binding protein [Tissierellales bacterium]